MAVEFLCSIHGTLIYFDETSHRLRHASGPGVPANAGLMTEDGVGRLVRRVGTEWRPLNGQNATGHIGDIGPNAAPLTFRIARLPNDLVGLEGNGVWLCADLDGAVALNRQTQGPWESFHPLGMNDREFLDDIGGQGWIASNGAVIPARGGIGIGRDFSAHVGPIHLPLRDLLAARRLRHPGGWSLVYEDWKVEHFTPFRPLIYMIAYGKPEIFETLALALRSLADFGQYDGDILIFSDRPPENVRPFVPAGMAARVAVAHAPAMDMTDMMAIKYRICDMPDLARYRPLLYLDTDVICNRPVGALLLELVRGTRVSVPLEMDLLGSHNYYGRILFDRDPAAAPRHERGFSAGLIGIPNIEIARQTFPAIRDAIYGLARQQKNRAAMGPIFHDQGVANYVMHKMDAAEFDILTRRVLTPVDNQVALTDLPRLGFAHFCGGVGDAGKKLPSMQAYVAMLAGGV